MAQKSKRWLLWIVVVGVLGILAVAVALEKNSGGDAIEVRIDTAALRTIVQEVSATGKIEPETEVKISSEVSGEVISVRVKEGDRVQRGQLLVRIRPDLLETQLEQFRAAVRAAEMGVEIARVEMDRSERELRRATELYDKGFLSKQEFETSKAAYDRAVGQYQSALAEKARAAASLRQAELSFSRTAIYAPMSGVVTKLNVEVGEKVVGTAQMQGTELLRIANLDTMNAIVEVNENDVVLVHIGDSAFVRVDAFRDSVLIGRVVEISHSPLQKAVGTQDEVVNFQVKIRLQSNDARLRPGMTCVADIRTARRDSVLAVPIQAVTVRYDDSAPQSQPGGTPTAKAAPQIVFVVRGDRVYKRQVRTGISDRGYIEILSGLRAGDVVVAGPYSAITQTLQDSARVRIKPSSRRSAVKNESL
ncbi:MAG: efflux RND transporter periplasmic adaptor subunit [Bacteroidota bacterium]|nr:efflux RND transporter periplasmic adaptor subunit [Candidatus Kapabacteria bacterium]MCX7936975.1 efflux RND transporter periplasmic adaptor subunit [Chlorobiota bacterium]MDW8272119.1 efflux RND transporter periplasmic adaptor subunit [Bacteroidota bacterium]